MSEPFSKTLYARWGDMDFNGHMKNTAYLDASADVRMFFFEEYGFSMREFESRRFGPVCATTSNTFASCASSSPCA